MSMAFVTALVFVLLYHSTVSASVCSPNERLQNLTPCLQDIKKSAQDRNKFWFGLDYAVRCPAHVVYEINCLNSRSYVNQSLASITFGEANTLADIDRYLDVTYSSKPGSYMGCSHVYNRNTTETILIDPLSNETIKPWDARELPKITWQADNNKQYTLIIQDVGFGYLHGLYFNIPGNDMTSAKVVDAYSGPLNFREIPNPYVFVLYEQQQKNMSLPSYPPITDPLFQMSNFSQMAQLKGPIAMTWIRSSYDAYSLNAMKQTVENCASLTTVAVKKQSFPFIKESSLPLQVHMEMNITSETFNFTLCCQNIVSEAETVRVDALSDALLSTAKTRTGSSLSIRVTKNRVFPNATADFKGQFLMLVMVDPDVPNPLSGTLEHPLLHYLAYNYQVTSDGELVGGKVILPYGGPTPPDDKPHRYVTLLYRQGGLISDNITTTHYTGNCSANIKTRCLFDLMKLEQNLTLSFQGAAFFRAERDQYVEYRKPETIDAYCAKRVPNCQDPTSRSDIIKVTDVLIMLVAAASILL